MEKRLPGLDLDALRSFVTGMECGSFAQAALRLSRSTSAVSAQLKKLESQCGAALVTKQGRHLVLTAEGEKLMSYARRLLALNDETLRALDDLVTAGKIPMTTQASTRTSIGRRIQCGASCGRRSNFVGGGPKKLWWMKRTE